MFIGRTKEKKLLIDALKSTEPQFVAIYGRRRVGKTSLVRETFAEKFVFQHAGMANSDKATQLEAWQTALRNSGLDLPKTPTTWLQAFDALRQLIKQSSKRKKIIFIDEMPWLDTQHSGFLSALEYFWNSWASAQKNLLLIVCGSSTSWIINKLIRNHGGLHNRVTLAIRLEQFSLAECEQFARNAGLGYNRRQILECYMAIGGVPFYWTMLKRGKSVAQNIDNLFFDESGLLNKEFDNLYRSLFNTPEQYIKIITLLGKKRTGLTRSEIITEGGIPDNGNLSRILDDLEYCGFIKRCGNWGSNTKKPVYQLVDFFTIFYFSFLDTDGDNGRNHWLRLQDMPIYTVWSGLAFERICFAHQQQIKNALGISGVVSTTYGYRDSNMQIDMVIDRGDGIIDLCEMKFTKHKFTIDEAYDEILLTRKELFEKKIKNTKSVHLVMVTSNVITENSYSYDIQNSITANDLFM